MNIGERIKNRRILANLSQTELSKLINISSGAVRHWELPETDKQSSRPSMKTLPS